MAMTDTECLQHAEACERRANTVVDREIRTEWVMLSIEWHYLASKLSQQKRLDELTFE